MGKEFELECPILKYRSWGWDIGAIVSYPRFQFSKARKLQYAKARMNFLMLHWLPRHKPVRGFMSQGGLRTKWLSKTVPAQLDATMWIEGGSRQDRQGIWTWMSPPQIQVLRMRHWSICELTQVPNLKSLNECLMLHWTSQDTNLSRSLCHRGVSETKWWWKTVPAQFDTTMWDWRRQQTRWARGS